MNETNSKEKLSLLHQLFSDNRAEWPSEHFGDLFVKPAYLRKLESMRPCILIGGRGTGKTTALQSLKYDATLKRLESEGLSYGDQEYLGILVRMNKNRVRAFKGGGIEPSHWEKAFAHYFNLLACEQLCNLGEWLENRNQTSLNRAQVEPVSEDLGLPDCNSISDLKAQIRKAIRRLQIYVNNPKGAEQITFSISESPLRTFVEVLQCSGLSDNKVVFCCIDEYENLLDYQQSVLNTYIKHAEPPLSYKVGVRKKGFRVRATMDSQDVLRMPDDYAEIHIDEEGFEFFAEAVGQLRLQKASEEGIRVPTNLKEFLLELSLFEEANLLGARKVAERVLTELKENDSSLHAAVSEFTPAEIYFLRFWQEGSGDNITDIANDFLNNQPSWKTRFGNHGYASLFWLSKGNKGKRIRKYYCGLNTFLALSSGNIRYFLELIEMSISSQMERNQKTAELFTLDPDSQTLAATVVGRRRLDQLEGIADHGVQLKRLALAIGKVFFEFARDPAGRTPEVNSFVLSGKPADLAKIELLLSEGVGHLAFEEAPRTKATSPSEIRDGEYRLHRIFSAFFVISQRKKRRTTFDAAHLLEVLSGKPSKAISALMEGQQQLEEDALPEQLAFFNAFYDGDSQP